MRRLLTILLVFALIGAAIAAFLILTTPKSGTTVRYPLSEAHVALLMRVPASAESFALIPTAPQLHAKLRTNPVTREAVETWTTEQHLPPSWALGGADIVAWKNDKKTSYAIRVDGIRAFMLRAWLMISTNVDARWDGRMFVINGTADRTLSASELELILRLAAKLPEGDVFVVQRESARGAFPPTSRPAVSSVRITPAEIVSVTRARSGSAAEAAVAPQRQFPKGALLSVTFARPPRILEDVRRLLRADIGGLVANGGMIALYDVDTGTLLPKPEGVVVVPASPASRVAAQDLARIAELIGETRDTGTELLISFDRSSVGLYSKDTFEPGAWPANRWSLRLDPVRMVPILERLGDSTGLRIAAPRIHRAARDLRRWIRYLEAASRIDAADSAEAGVEELRVRITSK